ncbi:unnamed protein product [Meloidogyne enterolobii]|uniref:Uncharacterized protein n=1 Tax=Meloidogyne enterolobii TaxID=390850 RepID=A0ACB0ZZ87_MELEN
MKFFINIIKNINYYFIQFLFFPIFIFCLSCNILTKQLNEKIQIKTPLGIIEGRRYCINDYGDKIDVFFGIPFALPPIGNLRFEKPKSIPKWKGIRLATQPPPACIYHAWPEGFDKKEKNYSEDCLYLNIFAPKIVKRKTPEPIQLYPILFIIHGGGFEVGSSHEYHNYTEIGKKFVSQGIIVISIHYRLGWIGFGSTGNDELPGFNKIFLLITVLSLIQALGVYFSIPLIDWASNRAWASIRAWAFIFQYRNFIEIKDKSNRIKLFIRKKKRKECKN